MVIVNGKEIPLYSCAYDYFSGRSLIRPSVYGKVGQPAARVEEISLAEEAYFFHHETKGRRIEKYGEFPTVIEVDGIEYILVDGGKDGIVYLKTLALFECLFIVLQRVAVLDKNGCYEYPYCDDSPIFKDRYDAEKEACVRSIRGWKAEDGILLLLEQLLDFKGYLLDVDDFDSAWDNFCFPNYVSHLDVAVEYREVVNKTNSLNNERFIIACDTEGKYIFTDDAEHVSYIDIGDFEKESDSYYHMAQSRRQI
jgi:hypothetical protein